MIPGPEAVPCCPWDRTWATGWGFLRLATAGFAAELTAASPVYETAPWGGVEQPDFLNAVLLVASPSGGRLGMAPARPGMRDKTGRVREVHWGPRTLDVDVVAVFGPDGVPGVLPRHPDLLLPHPGAAERNTVLRPWLDLDPDAVTPRPRRRINALLAALLPETRAEVHTRTPRPSP